MQQQIKVMLDLQEAMNSRVHEQWRDQGFQWYRAIWVECAELMDHYGWKWWKHQAPDIEQVQLELIDIWHFGMSDLLQAGTEAEELAVMIEGQLDAQSSGTDFRAALEDFVQAVLNDRSFPVSLFSRLMAGVGLSFEGLYRGYIGKNVLNFFRQDNGYQDGTYRKQWAGREDNEHLVEISGQLDINSTSFQQDLYTALQQRYQEVGG